MLSTDEQRAWYGPDHVALAVDRGAVGTLLISDELFRYVHPQRGALSLTLLPDLATRPCGESMYNSWRTCASVLEKCSSSRACTSPGSVRLLSSCFTLALTRT